MGSIDDFGSDIKYMSDKIKPKGNYNIEITLTDECNFRCKYCFEGDECTKTTTLDCVDDVFDGIERMMNDEWFLQNFGGIRIGFWGGEPSLRPDILKLFVDKYKNNDFISFNIYTNGYVVDGMIDIFKPIKDRISIQVSYDGARIHDIKRLTVGNKPTSERVKKNIYKLHENGYKVSLKSTVTYDTIQYMSDCWDDIKKINDDLGDNMRYSITIDYFNVPDVIDMGLFKKSFIDVAKKEIDFYSQHKYFLFTWFESTQPKTCSFFRCGFSINTNGKMVNCHGCGYSPESSNFEFGHISDDDIVDKIKNNFYFFIEPEKSEECKNCMAVNCVTCNVVKYEYSDKETFIERWYDLSCQTKLCDMYREFSKVSISLRDIIGGR